MGSTTAFALIPEMLPREKKMPQTLHIDIKNLCTTRSGAMDDFSLSRGMLLVTI